MTPLCGAARGRYRRGQLPRQARSRQPRRSRRNAIHICLDCSARHQVRFPVVWCRARDEVAHGPGKDIELIHVGHRYAVVWPSVHDKTGAPYIWIDYFGHESEVPNEDELAWLPDEWQLGFTGGEVRQEQPNTSRPPAEEERAPCLTEGEACKATKNGLAKYVERTTVQARHDSMIKTVMGAGEARGAGTPRRYGCTQGPTQTVPRGRLARPGDGSEQSEFHRAGNGAIAKVTAWPTPEDKRGCCGGASRQVPALNLPEEFWNSRPMLGRIRQAAHSRGAQLMWCCTPALLASPPCATCAASA
jgi:hypothetical protein